MCKYKIKWFFWATLEGYTLMEVKRDNYQECFQKNSITLFGLLNMDKVPDYVIFTLGLFISILRCKFSTASIRRMINFILGQLVFFCHYWLGFDHDSSLLLTKVTNFYVEIICISITRMLPFWVPSSDGRGGWLMLG